MALFRCASGGGGGGQITVTYDSDFYGETITCTRGQKVYSKVASSSGSVVFVVNEEGNWLIECTIGQDTYSTTASIEFTTSTELVSIPDGTTVLPTDDVETWLACAGIQDKAYTTLSEVLADSETFNALLGDSNACAYMARSTTWASVTSQTGLVPVMTSDTTPSGVASSDETGVHAYLAFDGDTSTKWYTSVQNKYLQYKFDAPTIIKAFAFRGNTDAPYLSPSQIVLKGSNDGSTFTSLLTISNIPADADLHTYAIENDTAYEYMRLDCTYRSYQGGGYSQLSEVQFYADADITTSQYAMSMLGQYDVCCNALLGNATWASAIANSTYAEYVLNTKVPTMTSDTTPSGEAFASSEYDRVNYQAWRAFDNSTSTRWASINETTATIGYHFTQSVCVNKVYVHSATNANLTCQLKGSNDGITYEPIGSSFTVLVSEAYTYSMANTIDYEYYELEVTATYSPSLYEVQFYGCTLSNELIHGTNNESAYYLDGATQTPIVDPSTLSAGTYTFGSTVAKNPSDLTADYTKTIRITPNTKEIVLRPDKTLYWWGYESANLEDLSTANGWNWNYTFTAPTHQTYGIIMQGFSDYGMQGVGGKTNYNVHSVKTICESVSAPSGYAQLALQTSKNISDGSATISAVDMVNGLSTITSDSLAYIRVESAGANNTVTLKAFWYE